MDLSEESRLETGRHQGKAVQDMGTCRKMRQRGGILHGLCPCVAIYGTGTPVWQIYYQKLEQIPHQQAANPEHDGEFFYMTEGFTLYSREELDRLTGILHGKLFDGIYSNSLVLWGYHMKWEILTEQEWNETKAEIHISFLGESPVKIITCDDNRTITVYKKK